MSNKNGKLTIYVDCVSPYSWFGFTNIMNYKDLLTVHGIEVDILPFFLGGARERAGNPYTPTPQWKAAFSAQDVNLTGKLLGLEVVPPKVFPISSMFGRNVKVMKPVRIATFVKFNYPAERFDATFEAFASGYWSKGIDISTPEGVHKALDGIFPAQEVDELMKKALTPENKKRVIDITSGSEAFGAPWVVGNNKMGETRKWFGNDRWDQVLWHLGVPYESVKILPLGESAAKL